MKQPSTYLDWLRVTAKGCFLSWRNLRGLLPDLAEALRDVAVAGFFVLAALLLPLLTPFSPIIALLLRREYRRQEKRAAEVMERFGD